MEQLRQPCAETGCDKLTRHRYCPAHPTRAGWCGDPLQIHGRRVAWARVFDRDAGPLCQLCAPYVLARRAGIG